MADSTIVTDPATGKKKRVPGGMSGTAATPKRKPKGNLTPAQVSTANQNSLARALQSKKANPAMMARREEQLKRPDRKRQEPKKRPRPPRPTTA